MLNPQYFGWLGHFLVVKRITTQANFHSLYLSFLDSLGDYGKGLVEAILASVYHSIGKASQVTKDRYVFFGTKLFEESRYLARTNYSRPQSPNLADHA
jgi:hypothetical protein